MFGESTGQKKARSRLGEDEVDGIRWKGVKKVERRRKNVEGDSESPVQE